MRGGWFNSARQPLSAITRKGFSGKVTPNRRHLASRKPNHPPFKRMLTLLITLIYAAVTAAAVLVHYEMLTRMAALLPRAAWIKRRLLLFSVFGALIAHIISIWIFAAAYYLLIADGRFGHITIATDPTTPFTNTLYNCLYFSIVNYTSLGYGDLVPRGHLGTLAGLEALTGLVLIAWTASFLFAQMRVSRRVDGDG